MKDARALTLGKLVAGEVAGGNGGVVALSGDANGLELALEALCRPRRVGKEHDDAALLAKPARRLDGGRISVHAVMHHSPNIHEPGGVVPANRLN